MYHNNNKFFDRRTVQTTSRLQQGLIRFGHDLRQVRTKCIAPAKCVSNVAGKSRLLSLLAGGISLPLGLHGHSLWAHCKAADRLTGFTSKVNKERDVRFDWYKFWGYLKPHLLKFFGAILVMIGVSIMCNLLLLITIF